MKNNELWLQMFGTYPWDDAGTSEVNPVNVTTQASMSVTMKTFYSKYLLENTRENIVFSQFGKREAIHGNTVEWRKFNTFPKALTPLTEAVIPTGKTFGMTAITASTTQHGDYVCISDRLELESYDNVLMGATEELGAAKGATYDTLTRNVLVAGTNVYYAPKKSGGSETAVEHRYEIDPTATLDATLVNRVATVMKNNKVPKIDGKYIWIIHPSQAYDLRESKGWLDAHVYANVTPLYNGEIGELHGFRFIEAPEVKVYRGAPLTEGSDSLTVASAVSSSATVPVSEAITAADATALAGRTITVAGSSTELTISSATAGAAGAAYLTLSASTSIDANKKLYATGGGADNAAVYASIAFGKDAFAIVDPEGEGQQMYIKDKSEIGGPIEQFSTVGYKFNFGAKILYQERLIRVETGSYFSNVDQEN